MRRLPLWFAGFLPCALLHAAPVVAQEADDRSTAPRRAVVRDQAVRDTGAAVLRVPQHRDVPWTELLDPERALQVPLSVGSTSEGFVRSAIQVPLEGEHHYVLAEHRDRDTHWGSQTLVDALLDASAWAHEQYDGMRVGLGNMSRSAGGSLHWSRSHHCGRDADLAFAYLDENGEPVEAPTLLVVSRRLTVPAMPGWTLDVPRTWAIVHGLIATHGPQIQWLFVSSPIREALLGHARNIGVSAEVLAIAEVVLHQPGDSAPHDDHLHLRVYCGPEEVLEGCDNRGPEWDHAELYEPALTTRTRELLTALQHHDATIREQALARILESELARAFSIVLAALPDLAPDVATSVFRYAEDTGDRALVEPLVDLARASTSPELVQAAAETAGVLAWNDDVPLLLPLLGDADSEDGGIQESQQRAGIRALLRVRHGDALVPLLALTTSPSAALRNDAATALCRMLADGGPTSDCVVPEPGSVDEQTWAMHWEARLHEAPGLPDDAAVEQALATALEADGQLTTDELVGALADERDWVRWNAERLLARRLDQPMTSEALSVDERVRHWEQRSRPNRRRNRS